MASWRLLLALTLTARAGLAGPASASPSCAAPRCRAGGSSDRQGEYTYTVDDVPVLVEFTDGGFFKVKCSKNLTLDNPAIPRFESQLLVYKALLIDCGAPRGSLGAVLQRLNVNVSDKLRVSGAGLLAAEQLGGLGDLQALELIDLELAPQALAAPTTLRSLFLDGVRLPPGELRHLPRSLQALDLTRMGADVPRDLLERLPALVKVTVRDAGNVSVALGANLEVLALEMPAALVPSALTPSLRSLTVLGWAERRPTPWTSCLALETLNLHDVTAEELPARWVSDCVKLRVLNVKYGPQLRALHATSLRGAVLLQELCLTSCALVALPEGLLEDAVNLRELDLSGNFLKELPGGLFRRTHALQKLLLSKNNLKTDVFTSLKAVTSLRELSLSHNYDLRDSCGGATDTVRGSSPLQYMKLLTILDLKKTNTSLICRDWRENMPLQTLDLSQNNFTSITYADLQFRGSGKKVKVDLTSNPLRDLLYTYNDYRLAIKSTEDPRAIVTLGGPLACDCHAYWAVRALQENRKHLVLSAKCAHAQPLQDIKLEALLCDAPELCPSLPPSCTCATRDSGQLGPAAPTYLLRVKCERAGLTRLRDVLSSVPLARRDFYDWQLHLAHNRIANLSTDDLPKHLSVLDLSNNSISLLSVDAVTALLADKQRWVQLARNPLNCTCHANEMLRALARSHPDQLDYANLTCANASLLSGMNPVPCEPLHGLGTGAVAATAALVTLLVAATLAGLLWHPSLRKRLLNKLRERGFLPPSTDFDDTEVDDDERRFDVFLSFSHGDERFVREELVSRLESGPAPYRLCVHYRDWVPGGWIPAQIAASVRASHRTVAVVSEHFLRSAWARAEFQEAYALALRDARPRLVVVLLDDPAALPLDDKLRGYLASNTYVRWGDPWFWEKLRKALPRGRLAPGPAPSAPSVEVPPAPTPEVCSAPAAASSLNSPASSSCSSSSSSTGSCSSSESCSFSAGSAVELDRLMSPPATCGAQLVNDVAFPRIRAVPV